MRPSELDAARVAQASACNRQAKACLYPRKGASGPEPYPPSPLSVHGEGALTYNATVIRRRGARFVLISALEPLTPRPE